jgi:hypothetical protein
LEPDDARRDFQRERRGFEPHASGRCIRGHFSVERD